MNSDNFGLKNAKKTQGYKKQSFGLLSRNKTNKKQSNK